MNKQTREIIAGMLRENTGRSMLDSGDFYGRHWQQNQGREFEMEGATTLSFKYGYVDFTHNLWHWLSQRLEYNERADNFWMAWANGPDQKDKSWFESAYNFIAFLQEPWHNEEEGLDEDGEQYLTYPQITGLYGEGDPWVINTYNHENLLSQTIQFTYFNVEDSDVLNDGTYILLQIHGGADARGGYTAPRMFQPTEYEEGIFDDVYGQIVCPECGAEWATDDAYTWRNDDNGFPKINDLNEHEMVEHEPTVYSSVDKLIIKSHAALNQILSERNSHVPRTLVTDGDNAYCPVCGEGVLEAQ